MVYAYCICANVWCVRPPFCLGAIKNDGACCCCCGLYGIEDDRNVVVDARHTSIRVEKFKDINEMVVSHRHTASTKNRKKDKKTTT